MAEWFTPAAPVSATQSFSPTGISSSSREAVASLSTKNDQAFKTSFLFRALLYNVRGIHKKPAKLSALIKLLSGYHLVALTETHIPHDTFGFPGWTVFASPRKLKKRLMEIRPAVSLSYFAVFSYDLFTRNTRRLMACLPSVSHWNSRRTYSE